MSLRVRLAAAALVAVAVAALSTTAAAKTELTKNGTVITYDRRSLMIDGRREIFFSGSIHYPRSPPDLWPDLIAKAKEGGLNVVETYVFWNIHEPEKDVVSSNLLIDDCHASSTFLSCMHMLPFFLSISTTSRADTTLSSSSG
jgi:hypothetical protein